MHAFDFITANKVICAVGAARRLPDCCRTLGIKHLLLVTDPGIMQTGMAAAVIAELERAGIEVLVYSDIQADPPEALVLAAVGVARAAKIDGVMGFGGGSSMDVAKLIAVLAPSTQTLAEIYGIGKVCGQRLPLIQVPTTAGTGSEVTAVAIVTTGATTKTGVVAPQLLPDIALLDAELTLGLPPHVTAATGIDAMVHAIEAFTSRHQKNCYSDMLAQQALRLLASSIVRAVREGSDLTARSNMLLGAMLAGQAFANAPVAAVHALAYPLGGYYHIPHGLSNALVLPHVLRFNAEAAAALYAQLLPCVSADAVAGSVSQRCDEFIAVLEQLIDAVALPKTLREMQVRQADLPLLADAAMLQTRLLGNNPRALERADALAIYRAAY